MAQTFSCNQTWNRNMQTHSPAGARSGAPATNATLTMTAVTTAATTTEATAPTTAATTATHAIDPANPAAMPDAGGIAGSVNPEANRRPLKSRSNVLIQAVARSAVRRGWTPNGISVASVLFALLGGLCLLVSPLGWGAILCAAGIQLRLLCNVVDGLVAIEGGRKTSTGMLYNEVPDRVADTVLLVAAGYAVGAPALGWAAATAAVFTAYVRLLGGSLGQVQRFTGPLAKQHRMALLMGACLLTPLFGTTGLLQLAVIIITVGGFYTGFVRLKAVAAQL
jgi:CDP-diaglycerol-glycerol-3-phosphatidyltransferase